VPIQAREVQALLMPSELKAAVLPPRGSGLSSSFLLLPFPGLQRVKTRWRLLSNRSALSPRFHFGAKPEKPLLPESEQAAGVEERPAWEPVRLRPSPDCPRRALP
jgi:hypothetical protein